MGDLGEKERCFWITLTEAPPGVVKRVFVPLCSTALHSGDPGDCSCDRWPSKIVSLEAKVDALQTEIGDTRRRAQRAEDALESRERRLARDRVRLADYRKRLEAAVGRPPSRAVLPTLDQIERAKVVAWLRGWNERIGGSDTPAGLADEIEAGLHLEVPRG